MTSKQRIANGALMQIPERITVRLAELRRPIEKWCKDNGVSASDAVRHAIAKMLGCKPPVVRLGNPKTLPTGKTRKVK
jgi:hypothetical protein